MVLVLVASISVYVSVGFFLGLCLLRADWRREYAASIALVWPLLPALLAVAVVERAYFTVRLLVR